MPHQRIVLKTSPDLNDPVFFELLMGAVATLEQDGQHFVLMSEEVSEASELHQITWQLADDELTELSLVKDSYADVTYLTARSPKQWLVQRIVEAFTSQLEFYSSAELFQLARQSLPMHPNSLYQLALIARKYDPELAQILRDALEHRLAAVRYSAARAMAVTQWRNFEPDLDMALKLENDADVRSMAEYAVSVCAKDR